VKETTRLDKQRRLYVPKRMLETCDLKVPVDENALFWVAIGDSGQLQFLPPDSKLSKLRDELEGDSQEPEGWDAAGDEETQVVRQLQSFLRATCHATTPAGVVSITFTAKAAKEGHLTVPSNVVVVTTGKIFEIWNAEDWRRSSRISDLRQFTEDAEKILSRYR